MKSLQRPPLPAPRQLSLLADATRPTLSPGERREVVALLAGQLIGGEQRGSAGGGR